MIDIKELLLLAASALRDYERDFLAQKLENAADNMEPVAWCWMNGNDLDWDESEMLTSKKVSERQMPLYLGVIPE